MDSGFYCMDCMEAMKQFPDKFFELAIIDPPYGIGEDGLKNHSRGKLAISKKYIPKQWDKEPPKQEYFNELLRVSKNQIIWGANHFISRIPFDSSCWIVWDKQNGETDFADCELAWTSFKTAVRKFTYRWQGMLQGNMKNKEIRIHPTQKPVALYTWLLNNYAKKGDKILDTHVGSASSLIACHKLGFEYWGFEIDPDYYALASARLEAVKSQISIFDEPEPTEKLEQDKFI
jgi:site-specific DNA-methyltransferase (adenine-specific)